MGFLFGDNFPDGLAAIWGDFFSYEKLIKISAQNKQGRVGYIG